jgi:hypothetical protein
VTWWWHGGDTTVATAVKRPCLTHTREANDVSAYDLYIYAKGLGIKNLAPIFFITIWLITQEASAPENRTLRPWIITMGHRPMYCSNNDRDDCTKHESVVCLTTVWYKSFYYATWHLSVQMKVLHDKCKSLDSKFHRWDSTGATNGQLKWNLKYTIFITLFVVICYIIIHLCIFKSFFFFSHLKTGS